MSGNTVKLNKEQYIEYLAEKEVMKEINASIQSFNYNLNSLQSTNGQAPFVTLWMNLGEAHTESERADLAMLIREFLLQRIQGMKNKDGVYITIAFPKLVLCLDKYLMSDEYKYLRKIAAECSSKRLVPDYVSEKIMLREKIGKNGEGAAYPPMGCRAFLTPDRTHENLANAFNYSNEINKYYGRANIGVTSLNLPYIAFEAAEREKDFFDVLDKYADLAHQMQKIRAKRISETKAKVAPILWCDGAYARLDPEENLSKLVHNGYMTSSIGYSGLYECVKKITGKDFWNDKKAHDFAVKVLKHLNTLCSAWKAAENIDYSIYGTPNESGTYKMALAVKRDFGDNAFIDLDGHDREYVTNSCHVPVFEEIDAFSKLGVESEYQLLSPGGNITYIETPDMSHNLDAVMEVMRFIYNNVMYSEINCESSYCSCCKSFNTIKMDGERGHYKPVCSVCGNDDRSKLSYSCRVCGYIATNEFNAGRAEDIHDRVKHLDNKIVG